MLSPVNSKSSSNSENNSVGGLPNTFTKRFNLPLCAIPKQICSAPEIPQFCIKESTNGIKDSAPSIPNLFIPGYLEDKNLASPSAEPNRFNM